MLFASYIIIVKTIMMILVMMIKLIGFLQLVLFAQTFSTDRQRERRTG